MRKVVDGLLILGSASLIYFKRITEAGGGAVTSESISYRSDFVFLFAVLLAIVVGAPRFLTRGRLVWTQTEVIVFGALASYLMFCVIATLLSTVIYNLRFDLIGFSNFGKHMLASLLCLVTYLRLKDNPKLYKWLAVAFFVPPAVPLVLGVVYLVSPAMYLALFEDPSAVHTQVSLLSDAYRFQGLASNPFQMLTSGFVAIAFVLPMTVRQAFGRKWRGSTIGFLYVIGLVFLIFWTMTRTGLVMLVFAVVFGSFMALYHLRKDVMRFLVTLVGALLVVGVAWMLMPEDSAQVYLSRFYSRDVVFGRWEYYTGGRIDIWRYFIEVALDHPLGVGFNFEQKFTIDSSFQERLNPHSGLLMAWMFGGLGGMLSVLVFMGAVLRLIRIEVKRYRMDPGFLYYVGAVTGMIGIWIAWQGPTFSEFTHAILLAMVLHGTPTTATNPAVGSVTPAVSPADVSIPRLAGA